MSCFSSILAQLAVYVLKDALSAELNNLGTKYEKDLLEKAPVTSTEQKRHTSQTFIEREQYLRSICFH